MKFTPTQIVMLVVTVITAVATASSDVVQAFWSAHPAGAPIALLVYKTLALLMPSPVQPAKKDGPQ